MSGPPDIGEGGDYDDSQDLTAAEYALGVLDADERAAAEARSDEDPAFALQIFEWLIRLAPLYDAVPAAEPSLALWQRIESAIAPLTMSPTDRGETNGAANDFLPRRLRLWRTWAVGATAVAAAALLIIALRTGRGPLHLDNPAGPPSTLVATLNLSEGGASALTVAYDPGRSTLYASPDADFSIPHARAAELWLIPQDGKPRPLGVIDASKPATMPMPAELRSLTQEQATLALSIEPLGGSKTGSPTGPVIATGKLSAV